MGESYSFSMTTFSPTGKLHQIDYALAAVAAGAPSIGIKVNTGVILATEKKKRSILYEHESIHKIETVAPNIGMVYAGLGPDFRFLVRKARKSAQSYMEKFSIDPFHPPKMRQRVFAPVPPQYLVSSLASFFQDYTQSGGVRPFGVAILVAGWDGNDSLPGVGPVAGGKPAGRPYLYQCDPSGAFFPWKATALGKNSQNAKTFLEKRYDPNQGIDDAVTTALLTLKESFEGLMTADNVEVARCTEEGFYRFTESEVDDYLKNLPSS